MKIALYIADSGSLVDKLINAWTGFYGYSHSEIVFESIDKKGETEYLCCSASPRAGKVRFTHIDLSSGHWHLVDYRMPEFQEQNIYNDLKKLEGAKYDWKGIFLTFIFKWFNKQNDKKWWCSEICGYILDEYIVHMNYRISPNKLAKKLKAPKQPFSFKFSFRKSY